ncbi:MAG: DUF2804 domain-containing protein [Candidatus Binatia bacterium]|nr:DUF2804 domain-containing protein [Candidatus Binatia bacterium]
MRFLCDDRGGVRYGRFEEPVEEIDYRRCRLIDEYDRPAGRWRRYFGFKQFEFLGGVSEQVVFGCALVNVRYAASAFLYVYWPRQKLLDEFSFVRPLALGVTMDQRPEDGLAEFASGGARIRFSAGRLPRSRQLIADLPGRLVIEAEWDEESPPTKPMRICTRSGAAGWVFARKTAGQQVRGTLETKNGRVDLASVGTLGHRDWSAGYMRRETHWLWGCLAGRANTGEAIGLNISCGVNETSFTENCFWVDGQREDLWLVHFDFERTNFMRPWRMTSNDGRCQLSFQPEACHRERMRLGILGLNFCQLIGRYSGELMRANGDTLHLERQLGYAEWQYAKW